jgi:hypothetical protein
LRQQLIDFFAGESLFCDQRVGDPLQLRAAICQDRFHALIALIHDPARFLVYLLGRAFAVIPFFGGAERREKARSERAAVGQFSQLFAHPESRHHLSR